MPALSLRPTPAILVVSALLLSACPASHAPSAGEGEGEGEGAGEGEGEGEGVHIPGTAGGTQFAFILDGLNADDFTLDEMNAHFDAAFLAQASAGDVLAFLHQLAASKPFTLLGFTDDGTGNPLTGIVRTGPGSVISLLVDVDAAGLIDGLFISDAPELDPDRPTTFAALSVDVAAIAPGASLYVGEVGAAGCTDVATLAADDDVPLGSEFKLWVLASLADEIVAGTHTWSETLAVSDAQKSLPSGTMQNDPDGTTHPLSTFAEQMISISDNTAADHLIHLLTPERIESELTSTGHRAPALDIPWLTTRELFLLKLLVSPADQDAYIAMNAADKRAYLTGTVDALSLSDITASFTSPIHIHDLEWFASGRDICDVWRHIDGIADGDTELAHVVSINPGVGGGLSRFSFVGFKGGSEPGVLTLSWMLHRQDGRRFVVWLAFADDAVDIDLDKAVYAAEEALVLTGDAP